MERDYYSLLGVSRFASQDAVRRAFRSRILLAHPDRNPNDAAAVECAREIIEAYKVLSDPWQRQSHDLALAKPVRGVTTCQRESSISFWTARTAMVVLVVAIAISLVAGVTHYLLNRTPVYRPLLGVIDLSESNPVTPAVVAVPDVSDTREWYAAQEYEVSLASDKATRQLIEVYSEAARAAAQHGDPARARFYTRCIEEVRNSGPTVTL